MPLIRSASAGMGGAVAEVIGADSEDDDGVVLARPGRPPDRRTGHGLTSSVQTVKTSSNWSTKTAAAPAGGSSRSQAPEGGAGRIGARREDHRGPAVGHRDHAGIERRQEAGPHQRGLAAAGRADHRQQSGAGEARHAARRPAARARRSWRRRRPRTRRDLCTGRTERTPGAGATRPPRAPPGWRAAPPAVAGCPRRCRRSPPREHGQPPTRGRQRPAASSTRSTARSPGPLAGLLVDPAAGRHRSARGACRCRPASTRRCRRQHTDSVTSSPSRPPSDDLGDGVTGVGDRSSGGVGTEGGDDQHRSGAGPGGEISHALRACRCRRGGGRRAR